MPNRLQLCVFHYHLKPGGVTDVIMGWIRVLARYSAEIFPQYRELVVRVCCGSAENVAQLQSEDFGLLTVDFAIDSRLGYDNQDILSFGKDYPKHIEQVATHLLEHYNAKGWDNLWWLHNYHLGKNVDYTQALLQIVQQLKPANLSFLLHIHDFPECGRLALYQKLLQSQCSLYSQCSAEVALLYPIAPNVCYSTINKRDLQILRDAGLPEQKLFFLPNPVIFDDLTKFPVDSASLRMQFNQNFCLPDAPLALYPVRCIRRKNILELALLNVLTKKPWNLVCTLPGVSESEQLYSKQVENLYQNGVIQGACHVGLQLEQKGWSFAMLCHAADIIVSSSVMEGFGFTYFNSMYWGKTLFARYLDVLQGFEHCFEPALSLFYRQLKIPLYKLNGRVDPILAELYFELQQKYSNYMLGLPAFVGRELQREFSKLLKPSGEQLPEYLDFALFNLAQQKKLLWRLHHHKNDTEDCFLLACRQANSNLLQGFESFLFYSENLLKNPSENKVQQNRKDLVRKDLATEFAPQRLAKIFKQASMACLSDRFVLEPKCAVDLAAISYNVLRSFSKWQYHYAILLDDCLGK